jgi:hypothetical protein
LTPLPFRRLAVRRSLTERYSRRLAHYALAHVAYRLVGGADLRLMFRHNGGA